MKGFGKTEFESSVSVYVRPNSKLAGRSLLDVKAASGRLGCSERFVRRLVQRIPFVKLAGTKVRFDEIELDLWLDAQRVEAIR